VTYSDDFVADILKRTKTIAMVGVSPKWVRPSNFVMKYLIGKGYRVIPVNPVAVGTEILGEPVYASLADIPDDVGPIDMVDVFRASDAAGEVCDEAIAEKDRLGINSVWMQLGVINEDGAARVEEAGLDVIMDRCPKIEFGRLFGELSWSGVNSGIISAKRPRTGP